MASEQTLANHDVDKTSRKYRRRYLTLGVLSVSLILIALDVTVLNVAIPTLQTDLGASAAALQWVINAYILVFAGLLLTMGTLGDRYGRRLALEIGLVIFAVASIGAAYSDTSAQLVAARAAQGIGGALVMPSTLSVIIDVFPREERAKAIGIWSGAAGLGVPVGMILGGWLVDQFFWGSVFLINVPVVLAALVGSRLLVPESRDPSKRRIDVIGALLSMFALGALVYTIIEAPERGWGDPATIGGFAAALGASVAFALYELRTHQPMLDIRFFKNPRLSTGAAAIGIAFMSMLGMMFLMTLYLQFVRDYTPLQTGVRLAPLALGFMVAAPTSALLVGRFGGKVVIAGGLTVVAIALAQLAVVDVTTPYWAVGVALFVMGLGMGGTMAPATDAVMAAVPESQAGVGSALNDTTRQVGGALGIGVFGSIFNTLYASNVSAAVSGLPAEAAAEAKNSIGAAVQVAAESSDLAGQALLAAANSAFVDATSVVYIVAGAIAFIGSLLVFRFMPAQDLVPGESSAFDGPGDLVAVPVRADE